MERKRNITDGLKALALLVAALSVLFLVSCAQKQAEVEKLEMEMLAASMNDSLSKPLDSVIEQNRQLAQTPPVEEEQHQTVSETEENQIDLDTATLVSNITYHADSLANSTAADSNLPASLDSETHFDPDQVPSDAVEEEVPYQRPPGEYSGGGGYTLQIASTDSRMYAEEVVQTFKERGYQPYITEISVDGITRYRVRVGQYANSTLAKLALDELQQEYGVVGWVDVIR